MARTDSSRRDRLAQELVRRGIRDAAVLDALRQIPRERFVEEALGGEAYRDAALPIGDQQTISQPYIVARMSELAEPDPAARVLEIGTGSGYQAAVLSRLFARVYSVERIARLSHEARRTLRELGFENVHFKIFDGGYGWSEFAPYRAILITAAVPDAPPPLLEQLEEGGRLIAPVGSPGPDEEQVLVRFWKRGGTVTREEHGRCRFVPLRGRFGFTE